MSDLYAWAPISHKNADGSDASLKPGDKVTNEFLNDMEDPVVDAWKHDGVIRPAPYPKDVPHNTSVRTHLLRKANLDFEKAQAVGSPQPLPTQAERTVATMTESPAAPNAPATTTQPTPNAPQS